MDLNLFGCFNSSYLLSLLMLHRQKEQSALGLRTVEDSHLCPQWRAGSKA